MNRWIPLVFLATAAPAHASTLYKCVGTDGRTTYTNQKMHGKCEILVRDQPVSTFPPPAARQRQPTPADFPRVSPEQQQTRDNDRRAILEQELASETGKLDAARKALAEQENLVLPQERIVGGGIQVGKREERVRPFRDRVALHERNVEAIRREVARIR